jgi:hypothetical protein
MIITPVIVELLVEMSFDNNFTTLAQRKSEGISPFHWLGIAYRYFYFIVE